MPSQSRRSGRPSHLSLVSDAPDAGHRDLRNDLMPMLSDLETIDQTTVERVAMHLQATGVAASAAVVAMRQAAEEVDRSGRWSEIVDSVGTAFAERGWDSAVLVTDPWHAMRAERMAEDAGISAESSPTRQGPAVQTRATQFRYILRETAAYLLYRATGESVAGAPGIG